MSSGAPAVCVKPLWRWNTSTGVENKSFLHVIVLHKQVHYDFMKLRSVTLIEDVWGPRLILIHGWLMVLDKKRLFRLSHIVATCQLQLS